MTTVRDISRWLDRFAPPLLAESWDNIGLLWGDADVEVSRVMTCLTVTPGTAQEALDDRAELIVSHHPVLFRAVKRIVAGTAETGMLWSLARAGVTILSPHTAFDNTTGGINDGLARRLGLMNVKPLKAISDAPTFKIVVFTPDADRESVLSAAFASGAGRIGAYEECSYAVEGHGTFFGTAGSSPRVGEAGRREEVREQRIEMVCPADRLPGALAAIRRAHSYEEPAIDAYPLHPQSGRQGAGRLGTLKEPTTLGAFARVVATLLEAPGLQFVGDPLRQVARVAIVCGAGDSYLGDAVRAGADVLLTGEARFHPALDAEARGIGLVVAGHHATERPGVVDLAADLAGAFPGLSVWPSRREHDPFRSIEYAVKLRA